jgi:hydrogenase/urease accessory protein HupE
MLEKLRYILPTLCVVLFTPVAMAHSGEHGAGGFISALLHQLTAADHWLIVFVICLFAGLFISTTRRS